MQVQPSFGVRSGQEEGADEVMTQTPPHGNPSVEPMEQGLLQQAQDKARKEVVPTSQSRGPASESTERGTLGQTQDLAEKEVPPTPQSGALSADPIEQGPLQQAQDKTRKEVVPTPQSGASSTEPIEQGPLLQAQEEARKEVAPNPQSGSPSIELMERGTLGQTQDLVGKEVFPTPQSGSPSTEYIEQYALRQTQDLAEKEVAPAPQSWVSSTESLEQRALDQKKNEAGKEVRTQTIKDGNPSLQPMEQETLEARKKEGRKEFLTPSPQHWIASLHFEDQGSLEQTQDEDMTEVMAQSPESTGSGEPGPLEQTQNEVMAQSPQPGGLSRAPVVCAPEKEPERKRCYEDPPPSGHCLAVPAACKQRAGRVLERTPSFGRCVKFLLPPTTIEDTSPKEDELRFFQGVEQMLGFKESHLKNLFTSDEWTDLTEDKLLRKRVLKAGLGEATRPLPGQEVMVKLLGIREDGTLVEKDPKMTFILDEGDVIQALELGVQSMQLGEESFLLTDALYAFGLLGRDPDIPAEASLLYDVTLLRIQDRPSLGTLTAADCISLGNQKRECGNFHFEREEYRSAMRSYNRALSILESPETASLSPEEKEELRDHRIKCMNNLAATQLKLHLFEQVLVSCNAVLELDMDNVKALYRKGKLLSERGDHDEAMSILKSALKLEPTTKAIHAELSKLVKRRKGIPETAGTGRPKTRALLKIRGDLNPLLPRHHCTWKRITPWTMIIGAMVAVASIVMAVRLSQED